MPAKTRKDSLKLLNDQALHDPGSRTKDGLGFEHYSKVLGEAAYGTQGPFTIGVFGEWGTGKTSLLRMTKQYVDTKQNVVTVWFNAWRYEQEEHPIVPLVATIIQSVETYLLDESITQKIKKSSKELIRSLRAIAYGFSAKAKVKVPGFAEIEAGFVAKDMIEREEKLRPDPLLDRSLYYEAFETLDRIKSESGLKIVVFIDDLDRCFPDKAIKLLESIKLVLAQPGFIFFLGVAKSVIDGYLKYRYKSEFGIENFEGYASYLDKMVQLSFKLPPHDSRMEEFSKELVTEGQIEKTVIDELEEILPIIGLACDNNPRKVVRFINSLLIDKAIVDQLEETKEKDIPLVMFAVTRSVEDLWPIFFNKINKQKDESTFDIIEKYFIDEKLTSEETSIFEELTKCPNREKLIQYMDKKPVMQWLRDEEKRLFTVQYRFSSKDINDYDIQGDYFATDLSGADLSFQNLKNKNFSFSDLSLSNLSNSMLQSAILFHTVLEGANLYSSNLEGANLENAIFNDAILKKSNLQHAKILETQFFRANLENAIFKLSKVSNSNFENANLSEANFNDSIVEGANFENAILIDACFSNSKIFKSNFQCADLANAIFKESTFKNVDFSDTNMMLVNLEKADLSGANLKLAYLETANLKDTNLQEADLTGAELFRVEMTSNTKVNGAKINEKFKSILNKFNVDTSDVIWIK